MNKTTQILTFSVMALMCLSLLVFAFIKADEADKAGMAAEEQRIEAERLKDASIALQQKVLDQVAQARVAEVHTKDIAAQLAACRAK